MQFTRNLTALLLFAFLLVSGCASSKKIEKASHPLAGSWTYALDTPQGIYTGVMAFTEAGDLLSGTITSDDSPDQSSVLEDLMFDTEMSKLSFKFDGGEFGTLSVNTTLAGDSLDGTMTVGAYGVDVAMTAKKKAE